MNHDWPGNVRELRNAMERALLLAAGSDTIMPENLPSEIAEGTTRTVPVTPGCGDDSDTLSKMEASHISHVLAKVGGNLTQAAEALGIHRNTLRRKLRDHGLP
jgi:transcriptional regulator with PAS, ATPase and Fis domain